MRQSVSHVSDAAIGRQVIQTHRAARVAQPSPLKTASVLNAQIQIALEDQTPALATPSSSSKANVIVRTYNFPPRHIGWDATASLYPGHPINFTPLRPVPPGLSTLDRAVRETPWESRVAIAKRRIVPHYMRESQGTPRVEFSEGMVDGVRVRPVFNPYYRPTNQGKQRELDKWRSRDWARWSPAAVSVRGGSKLYSVPNDLLPQRDELGEWHPPALSGRLQADVRRQFALNGLPWIYKKDFLENKMHIADREPVGPKRWYKREYRRAKIMEAMRTMEQKVQTFRKERRLTRRHTWFEQVVQKMVGESVASSFLTPRKFPRK